MKTLLKITLVLSLFGSVALADGDMPGGGYQCPPEGCPPPPPPCTQNCLMAARADDGSETVSEAIVAGTNLAIDFAGDTLGIF